MTEEQKKQLEEIMKVTTNKVRVSGMLSGATGIAGAVMDICRKKQNPALTVKEIQIFCQKILGLKGEESSSEHGSPESKSGK